MKILVAPCAYKGTISCSVVAQSIARAIKLEQPGAQVDLVPIADGGDGTIEALYSTVGGELRKVVVEGPAGRPVEAFWLKIDRLAIVELACASGLGLLKGKLDPIGAHTLGTGQIIGTCLLTDVTDVVIGVGGSASTDGGSGLLTGLGARFLKADGSPIALGAKELSLIEDCDLSALSAIKGERKFLVAADVTNPLLGANGTAAVFARQKGASEEMIAMLEAALTHFASILEGKTGKLIRNEPGAGAGGGTGFGAACALDAQLTSGFAWIASLIQLESRLLAADLIIAGEGRLDEQSLQGKAVGQLVSLAKKHQKKIYALPALASTDRDWAQAGIDKVIAVAAQPGRLVTADDIFEAARLLLRS